MKTVDLGDGIATQVDGFHGRGTQGDIGLPMVREPFTNP